jgi:hypothetical protein
MSRLFGIKINYPDPAYVEMNQEEKVRSKHPPVLGNSMHYADPAFLETKQEESVMTKYKSAIDKNKKRPGKIQIKREVLTVSDGFCI